MQQFNERNGKRVTWREADKSWLKARGRSVRTMFDATGRQDGVGRYLVAAVATIALASTVGLSGVLAGPEVGGGILSSGLNPAASLDAFADQLSSGSVSAAAQTTEECGPIADDVSGVSAEGSAEASVAADSSVTAESTVTTDSSITAEDLGLSPIGDGDIPLDAPDIILGDDPNPDDPTGDPSPDDPTGDPDPGDEGSQDSDNLVNADVSVLGTDAADVNLLPGGLIDVDGDVVGEENADAGIQVNSGDEPIDLGVNSTNDDPLSLDAQNGEDELANVGTNPDGGIDTDVAGEDVLAGDPVGGTTDDLSGTTEDLLGGTTDDLLGGTTDDLLGGTTDDLLGDDPIGDTLGLLP